MKAHFFPNTLAMEAQRESVARSCVPMAESLGKQISRKIGRPDLAGDISQEAMIVAMTHYEDFDISLGKSYEAYIYPRMKRSAMMFAVSSTTPVQLPQELMRPKHREDVLKLEQAQAARRAVSTSEQAGIGLLDSMTSENHIDRVEENIDLEKLRMRMTGFMDLLDDKSQNVVKSFFGLNGHAEISANDIAEKSGETRSSVYKCLKRSMVRLREHIASDPELEASIRDILCSGKEKKEHVYVGP